MGKLTVKEDQRYRELAGLIKLLDDMKAAGNNSLEGRRPEVEAELNVLKAKKAKGSIDERNPHAAVRPSARGERKPMPAIKEPNLLDKLWQWCMKK